MSKKNKLTKKVLLERAKPYQIQGAKKLKKAALIHQLQLAEGYVDCFGKIPNCSIETCFYRKACQK
ncbi:MAG: hypothetical protein Q9M18_06065 [Mariprofundaceae bacterium]|nr:hypothetical protein [Mariprofundaceae bacterium]